MRTNRAKIFKEFSTSEKKIFASLNSAKKIQDFLNRLEINMEERGETLMSPRRVLRKLKAHCAEGALFAAAAFWYHGAKPLLMDIQTSSNDHDHVVALFRKGKFWGAISKTNHAVLRYREPVYKTVRELALSYFHEYFKHNGQKTMRAFSLPFDLSKIKDHSWLTSEDDLWDLIYELDRSPHRKILSAAQLRSLRRADPIEIKAGKLVEK